MMLDFDYAINVLFSPASCCRSWNSFLFMPDQEGIVPYPLRLLSPSNLDFLPIPK